MALSKTGRFLSKAEILGWEVGKRSSITFLSLFGTEFWEGDATKQKSVENSPFSLNGDQACSE